jgi:hypothetical protein
MRWTHFNTQLTEAPIALSYFAGRDRNSEKYISAISNAMKGNGTIFVLDTDNNEHEVSFDGETNGKKALGVFQSLVKQKENREKVNRAPSVTGVDVKTNKPVTFTLNKVLKKFRSQEGSAVEVNVNAGNVTEGALGFALAALFENTSQRITLQDALDVGKRFFAQEDSTLSLNVKDRTDDNLKIKVTLPKNDIAALRELIESGGDGKALQAKFGITDIAVKKFDKMLDQAVDYANNGTQPGIALNKVKGYYGDGIKQVINVVSDGAESENQNTTKVDLSLIVQGADGEDFEKETLSLLSLKAGGGASQVGQASGHAYANFKKFWLQNFNYNLPGEYKELFADTMAEYTNERGKLEKGRGLLQAILEGPVRQTYEWANQKINNHLQGDSEPGEEEFLKHLQKGLLFNTAKNQVDGDASTKTKGDEDVTVVILNPGGGKNFVELNFGRGFDQMLQHFNLESSGIVNAGGGKGFYIRITANVKNSAPEEVQELSQASRGSFLVQYRTAIKGRAMRNTVDIGPQSKVLANVANFFKEGPKEPEDIDAANADAKEIPPQEDKGINDPNATVKENIMDTTKEFGPNYNIVDDLHVYMRNDSDVYRRQYFPMLCAMQEQLAKGKKISAKEVMMPVIKTCMASYNKKFNLANESSDIITDEDIKTLVKKIYTEEIPLIKKGVYK